MVIVYHGFAFLTCRKGIFLVSPVFNRWKRYLSIVPLSIVRKGHTT